MRGRRRDPGKTLQEVQSDSLAGQDASRGAGQGRDDFALSVQDRSIIDAGFESYPFVDKPESLPRHI